MAIRERAGGRKIIKKKDKFGALSMRKRFCRLCQDHIDTLDYKDAKKLEVFIKERGKIASTRGSGNCAKHQRILADAIKKARYISLLPYTRA